MCCVAVAVLSLLWSASNTQHPTSNRKEEEKAPAACMSAAKKAVRLVAAMALKDVSDGYHLGQVTINCLIFVVPFC